MTEKLIECVRKHPCLYDTTHSSYKNALITANAWKQIGKEINETGDVAKKKWKSIRDNYMRYKKEVAGATGPGPKKFTKWPWVAQLQFLEKNSTDRERTTNVLRNANYSDTFSETSLPEISNPEESLPETLISPRTSSLDLTNSGHLNTFTSTVRTRARKIRKNERNMDEAINCIQNKKTHEFDAVDHLFQSYAKTFKSFSKQSQITIKLEMAKLFAEIERQESSLDAHVYLNTEDTFPYEVKPEPENGLDLPSYLSRSDSGASTSGDE